MAKRNTPAKHADIDPLSLVTHRTQARFGWQPDLPDARDQVYSAPAPVRGLPNAVDLRSTCPPVYDQGQLGSCTANAIAAAMEFDRKKQKLPDFAPSRLFIYYNERVMEGTVSSDAGAQIRDGVKSVSKIGAPPETDWPYDISKFAIKPPTKAYMDAKLDRGVQYQRVSQNLQQMQGCLASGFPFVFGFTVYQSFESGDGRQDGGDADAGAGREQTRRTRGSGGRLRHQRPDDDRAQLVGNRMGHERVFHHAFRTIHHEPEHGVRLLDHSADWLRREVSTVWARPSNSRPWPLQEDFKAEPRVACTLGGRQAGAVLALVAFLMLAGFASAPGESLAGTEKRMPSILTAADKGGSFKLRVGDEVTLQLPENASTGYRWAVDSADVALVEVKEGDAISTSKAIGAGGEAQFKSRPKRRERPR